MTTEEKNTLGKNIHTLNHNQLRGIIDILSEQGKPEQNSKYFEFDIEELTIRKARELEKYVNYCLQSNLNENKTISQLKV